MKMMFTNLLRISLLVSVFIIQIPTLKAGISDPTCSAEWPFMFNCPPNVTISCTDNIYNLSQYGNATYTTYYGTFSAGSPVVHYYLNNCNTGHITRTWMVEFNWVWYNCTQTIHVVNGGYYSGGLNIQWPQNYEISGCNPNVHPSAFPEPYRYPTWTSGPCSMIGRSYSDMVFYINSTCRKIRRTWKVMDWCTYNSNNPGAGGLWTYVQEIKITDAFEPVLDCIKEINADSYNCKDAFVQATPINVGPSNCGGTFEVSNNSPYSISKGADISGTYPIGTTKVNYTVKYGCGFTKFCSVNVIVKNAAKPTPYCLGHIITTLMPVNSNNDGTADDGMVEIWAKDLDRGSKANCGFNPLRFSFTSDPATMNRTFTCEDVGKNHVFIYVTDSRGGQSSCLVTVEIQNNANIPDCKPTPPVPDPDDTEDPDEPASPFLSGQVTDAWGNPLHNARLHLEYTDPAVNIITVSDTTLSVRIDSFINLSGYWVYRYVTEKIILQTSDTIETIVHLERFTDTIGSYRFDSIPLLSRNILLSASYTDTLHKKYINGKDVELLTRFLLGDTTFDSPYQYLAADVDENGIIDIQDMTTLMQYITGQIERLPGSNDFIVFNKNQQFDPLSSILDSALNEHIELDTMKESVSTLNFVVVRKGDIVNSIAENDIMENKETIAQSRTINAVAFSYEIYPNPFTDALNLKFETNTADDVIIQLFDLTGELIWSQSLSTSIGLNTMTLSPDIKNSGMIMYRLISGNRIHSGKVIKI